MVCAGRGQLFVRRRRFSHLKGQQAFRISGGSQLCENSRRTAPGATRPRIIRLSAPANATDRFELRPPRVPPHDGNGSAMSTHHASVACRSCMHARRRRASPSTSANQHPRRAPASGSPRGITTSLSSALAVHKPEIGVRHRGHDPVGDSPRVAISGVGSEEGRAAAEELVAHPTKPTRRPPKPPKLDPARSNPRRSPRCGTNAEAGSLCEEGCFQRPAALASVIRLRSAQLAVARELDSNAAQTRNACGTSSVRLSSPRRG